MRMTESSITLNGTTDYPIRGEVMIGHGFAMGGAFGAKLDGHAQVEANGVWEYTYNLPDLLSIDDIDRIETELCEKAIHDLEDA